MPPFAKANTMATRSLSAVLMALAFDPASAESTAVQRQEPTPAEAPRLMYVEYKGSKHLRTADIEKTHGDTKSRFCSTCPFTAVRFVS